MTVSYKILATDVKSGTFVVHYEGLQPLNFFIPNDGTKFLTGQALEEAIQAMYPGPAAPNPFENFSNGAEIEALVPPPEPPPPQPETPKSEIMLRVERLKLLQASDWTQMLDAPLTAEQKAEWAVYRQALRDVPQQAGFPETIDWPVVPA